MTPQLIGIAGPSCSGKTELARRTCERLGRGATVLPLDSYYRDLSRLEPGLRSKRNFDHPDSLDRDLLVEQLARLAAGRQVDVPVYRFDTHSRDPTIRRRVVPGEWVIVEGLFALCWKEVRRRLRLKVFIDLSDDVCLARRVARDVRSRGRTAESVRRQFARTVLPMYRRHVRPTRRFADLVVGGDEPLEQSSTAIVERIARVRP